MKNVAVPLLIYLGVDKDTFMYWRSSKNLKFTNKGPGRKHKQGL